MKIFLIIAHWETLKPGITELRNNGISKFRFYAFTITVNHSSLIFIAFQPADIISVCYNVGKLTYSVH